MKQYFYLKDLPTCRQFEWVAEEVNKKGSLYNRKYLQFRDKILKGEIDGNWTGIKYEFLAMSLCMLGVPVYDYKGYKHTAESGDEGIKITKKLEFPHKEHKEIVPRATFSIKTELGNFEYKISSSTCMGDIYYSTKKYTPFKYKIVRGDPFKKDDNNQSIINNERQNIQNIKDDDGKVR